MASIRVRPQRNGTTTYSVRWRDPDTGRETSYAFQAHREAENFRRLIEANHGHLAATESMVDAIARKMPLIREAVAAHIDGQPTITERTRADYHRDATRYIDPFLGWRPLDQLTLEHLNQWMAMMMTMKRPDGELLADKTIKNVHGLLSTAVGAAFKLHNVPKENPCRGVRLSRQNEHNSVEMVCLTRQEWATLDSELGKVLDGHHRTLFRTLAGTGIRWGEAAALRVSDLSLDGGGARTLRISRAQKRDAQSKAYVGPTKTAKSRRTIELPDVLADDLTRLTAGRAGDALVFTSRMGNRLNHSNVRIFAWLPAIEAAQDKTKHGAAALVHTPRIHDLRHSHASWLLAAGVDMYAVQRRLGHEQITTTTNVYGHLMPEQQRSAAAAANAVLAW